MNWQPSQAYRHHTLVVLSEESVFPQHILRKIAKPLGFDESLLMTIAGYLPPDSSSETGEKYRIYRGLDPYVAKVLSEEPVDVQRTMVTLFTILKGAIAESLSRKQD